MNKLYTVIDADTLREYIFEAASPRMAIENMAYMLNPGKELKGNIIETKFGYVLNYVTKSFWVKKDKK